MKFRGPKREDLEKQQKTPLYAAMRIGAGKTWENDKKRKSDEKSPKEINWNKNAKRVLDTH
jgi:hypothetical protein